MMGEATAGLCMAGPHSFEEGNNKKTISHYRNADWKGREEAAYLEEN